MEIPILGKIVLLNDSSLTPVVQMKREFVPDWDIIGPSNGPFLFRPRHYPENADFN